MFHILCPAAKNWTNRINFTSALSFLAPLPIFFYSPKSPNNDSEKSRQIGGYVYRSGTPLHNPSIGTLMDSRSGRAIGPEDHGTRDVRATPENNGRSDMGALQGARRKTFLRGKEKGESYKWKRDSFSLFFFPLSSSWEKLTFSYKEGTEHNSSGFGMRHFI